MNYLPPFETIKLFFTMTSFRGKLTATAPFDDVRRMISALLGGVHVDEAWYLDRNPDIAKAIRDGIVKSGKDHFVNDGYFEGRMPYPIKVDEAWYLAQYPEVAEAVRNGLMESAQRHFEEHGYREGRRPGPG